MRCSAATDAAVASLAKDARARPASGRPTRASSPTDAVARAIDQEPPRLAALARADARQARPSWRRSPPTCRRPGSRDVVLLGMGGSSLWPEVLSWCGAAARRPARCTSSTTPIRRRSRRRRADRRARRRCSSSPRSRAAPSRSRRSSATSGSRRWRSSGGDIARAGAQLRRDHRSGDAARPARRGEALPPRVHQPGRHRRAVLRAVVLRAGARRRWSAPTVGALLAAASRVRRRLGRRRARRRRARALVLGAALGAAAKAGRDKLTLVISPDIASFGSWIEQLVAESSGKDGKGIVPVDLEPVAAPEATATIACSSTSGSADGDAKQDAAVAALERAGQPGRAHRPSNGREALGREIVRWEVATAIACATLGVNPFDEPNVTEAKVATSALLAAARGGGQAARATRGHLRGRATSSGSARISRRRRRATTSPSARISCARRPATRR